MKRRVRIIGAAIFLMMLLSACAEKTTKSVENNTDQNMDLTNGFTAGTEDKLILIAENENLKLLANLSKGDIAIEDKSSGKVWLSNPEDKDTDMLASGYNKIALFSQVLLTYTTNTGVTMNVGSFMGCVSKQGLTYRIEDKSIIFKYEFVKEGLVLPVRYSLTGQDFVAEVLTAGVQELGTNKISTIDLLPFFGAGSMEDEGYILVPDGSGALINFNNKKATAQELAITLFGFDYGANDRLINSQTAITASFTKSENTYLPVFGEKCNDDGFLAILMDGAARATIHARVAGKYTSYNNVWSSYNYRTLGTVRLVQKEMNEEAATIEEKELDTSTNYVVHYRFLEHGKASYSDMAKVYRNHLIEKEGLVARTKEGDIPFYLDLYGYIKKTKSFLGFPKDTKIVTTSISDAVDITKKLSDSDINNIILKYNYWMKNGYYSKIQTDAKVERKIGSKKEMQKLEQLLTENGGSLYLATELMNAYKTGNGVSKYHDVLNSVANTPLMQHKFVLDSASVDPRYDPWYLIKPSRLSIYFKESVKNYKKAGFRNIAFDSIGTMTYSELCSNGTSRSKIPSLLNGILTEVKTQIENIMISGANSFTAVNATHILNTPMKNSGYDIEDASVPFYQMVFHGYAYYSLGATNLSSSPEDVALKCLEYGAAPMYSWVGRNDEELIGSRTDELFSANYEKWIDFAIKEYEKVNSVLKDIVSLPITSHRILLENVTETVYGDLVRVIVNYNDVDVTVEGNLIRGKDYLVVMDEQ